MLKQTITGIFLIISILLSACRPDMKEIIKITKRQNMPDMSGSDIELYYSEKGQVRLYTIAPEINTFESPEGVYTEFPKGLLTHFYDEKGVENSSLTADYAKYFQDEKIWEAKYKVRLVNTQGDVLETEHLFCNEVKRTIYTDKFVKITDSDGYTMSGSNGFESNLDFTEYEFKSVSGHFGLNNE